MALLFYPENGGSIFLHNVNKYIPNYTAYDPRRASSSIRKMDTRGSP
jgi:hypothetical protein